MSAPKPVSYSDAMDALVTISPLLERACFSVSLLGRQEYGWMISLLGDSGQQMDRLISHLNLQHVPVKRYPGTGSVHHQREGYHGTVLVRLTSVHREVTRVSGRV